MSINLKQSNYILNPFQTKQNYYALFEGWTLLAGFIIWYSQKCGAEKELWESSFRLVMDEIKRNLYLLKNEVNGRENFLEGNGMGDGNIVYKARTTIVLGAIAALELYQLHNEESHSPDKEVIKCIKENQKYLWIWGESAFPYLYNIICLLEKCGEEITAKSLLKGMSKAIVKGNEPRNNISLPNPYYSAHDVLEAVFGFDAEKIDFSVFAGHSYLLETIVLMLARRGMRELLGQHWRAISHIHCEEFKADNIEDTFIWNTSQGENRGYFLNETQSWKELVEKANAKKEIPEFLSEHRDLLQFFLLVCPHRMNKYTVGALELG